MQHQTDNTSSKDLHQTVLNEIDNLLKHLKSSAKDERVADTMKQVADLINPINENLKKRIEALQQHVRWDTFTIAFYGETNAGKSTIIETLRILLKEQTKAASQAQFHVKQAELGVNETDLSKLAESIKERQSTLETLRAQTSEHKKKFDSDIASFSQKINHLRLEIDAKKQAASFWKKFVWLFHKLPEQIELARIDKQRQEYSASNTIEFQQINAQLESAQLSLQSAEQKQAKAHEILKSLEQFADGQIIGTGRSDYTLDIQNYKFCANNQKFELLDVPGIEGKEARVNDSIRGAVMTAHAVFYVTGKPSAPQTGDKGGRGTLEKIHDHLGDQTEVWSIFNKRITNPIQLEKDDLLNQGERESLSKLDETMREHLGDNYQNYIALSAQPAFLAAADCLVPFSDTARNREKFLAKSTTADVLEKSGFQPFVDWLTNSMVTDCDKRIHKANVNKVRNAVQTAASEIKTIQQKTIEPLADAVKRDWEHVSLELELAVNALAPALQTHADTEIRTFEKHVREKLYERIDDGIDNDNVKNTLKTAMENEQKKLESTLPNLMKKELAQFQKNLEDTLKRFQQRIEELQNVYRSIDTPTLGAVELNMKFESGVKYMSLVAALAGGILMIWNPVGWVSLALGGVTLIVSIAKAVWGFFNSDYKKSQQRKAVDENIDRVVDHMKNEMKNNCEKAMDAVKERIDEIKVDAEKSVKQVSHVNAILIRVNANLTQLSTSMS